jgi:hypothetical protein
VLAADAVHELQLARIAGDRPEKPVAPGDGLLGVAIRCPACAAVSVNLVTREHLDVPFVNDARVGVVSHVFREDALRAVEEFRVELRSAHFDERRLDFER